MVVLDEYTIITLVFVLAMVGRTISAQGGALIVMWRILGWKWFLHTRIGSDGNTIRKAKRWNIIRNESVPMYTLDGKDWFVGGPDETARIYGGPQWVYRDNDSRPLPLKQVAFKMVEQVETVKEPDQTVEEKVTNGDGTEKTVKKIIPGIEKTIKRMVAVVIAGKPIDPGLINAAWQNSSIKAFNKLGEKPNKFRWGLFGLIIGLILIITAFNLLYTYYYDVNIACAVHATGVANCH